MLPSYFDYIFVHLRQTTRNFVYFRPDPKSAVRPTTLAKIVDLRLCAFISGVAKGGGPPWVLPFWGDTIL